MLKLFDICQDNGILEQNNITMNNFNDDYYIDSALRLAALHLDDLENTRKSGPYSIKAELTSIYKKRTGLDLPVNKTKYQLEI